MTDHAQIDLLIGTGNETVKFSVTGGSAKVHITGYEVLEETYDGFGDDDDSDDDEDDDEFGEVPGGDDDDSDDDDDDDEDMGGGQPSFFNFGGAADDDDSDDDSSEDEAPPPPPPPPKSPPVAEAAAALPTAAEAPSAAEEPAAATPTPKALSPEMGAALSRQLARRPSLDEVTSSSIRTPAPSPSLQPQLLAVALTRARASC